MKSTDGGGGGMVHYHDCGGIREGGGVGVGR